MSDEGDADVDTSTYNRWIGMLDGVIEGNWKGLMLDDTTRTGATRTKVRVLPRARLLSVLVLCVISHDLNKSLGYCGERSGF
jgi:hypothetical protein